MKHYKAGESGTPVPVWLNDDKPEEFPREFGTLASASENGVSEIVAPDGHRYTVGKGAAVIWENGALRVMQRRSFDMAYKETDEQPPESLQDEFKRRVLDLQERQHPGVVGTQGRARQGAKTAGPGQAGRDKESENRAAGGGPMPDEGSFGLDPSGSVPGAPFTLGSPNTGGSPHAMAVPAAQPELVQRGTDAKVEDPRRAAADTGRVSPGSGPEATASVLAPKHAAEAKQEEEVTGQKPAPRENAIEDEQKSEPKTQKPVEKSLSGGKR